MPGRAGPGNRRPANREGLLQAGRWQPSLVGRRLPDLARRLRIADRLKDERNDRSASHPLKRDVAMEKAILADDAREHRAPKHIGQHRGRVCERGQRDSLRAHDRIIVIVRDCDQHGLRPARDVRYRDRRTIRRGIVYLCSDGRLRKRGRPGSRSVGVPSERNAYLPRRAPVSRREDERSWAAFWASSVAASGAMTSTKTESVCCEPVDEVMRLSAD